MIPLRCSPILRRPYWGRCNSSKGPQVSIQIYYNDPRYAKAAAEILRRHDNGEPEASITSAVRDFLIFREAISGQELTILRKRRCNISIPNSIEA